LYNNVVIKVTPQKNQSQKNYVPLLKFMALKTITLKKYGHGRLTMPDCRKVIVVLLWMFGER
jgi:hypothetical protein